MIKLFRFFLLEGHFFLYFHIDKGHCLAKTGWSLIYNKVRNDHRWLCILFSLLSWDLMLSLSPLVATVGYSVGIPEHFF